MFDFFSTFFVTRLKRHLSNPSIWLMMLITPITAKYLVPLQSDSYSLLAINDAYPIATASVIGLQIGVICSLLFSPLVYVFFRSSKVNQAPWQIEDVTATVRFSLNIGHWLADMFVVLLFLLCLSISGLILSFFRLPLSQMNSLETIVSCLLICFPAFSFITALRIYFSSRPWLRGSTGDVVFFFIWLFAITSGALVAQGDVNFIFDLFGYAAPIVLSVSEPIENLAVGSPPITSGMTINLDAFRGITNTDYLISRAVWLFIAFGLVLVSCLLFKPRKVKEKSYPKKKRNFIPLNYNPLAQFERLVTATLHRAMASIVVEVISSNRLLISLLIISLAGLVFPFDTAIGPALWLILLFPFSNVSSRWSKAQLKGFLSTLPTTSYQHLAIQLVSFSLITFVLCLPSLANTLSQGRVSLISHIAFIVVFVPLLTVLLSRLFKSNFAVRLPMLIAWYVYFNAA